MEEIKKQFLKFVSFTSCRMVNNYFKAIESEIKCLQEDKKVLIEDLKDNHGIDPKVIRKAIQVAKIRTSLGDHTAQLDEIVEQIEGSIL